MAETTPRTLSTGSETTSQTPTFPDYIQKLMIMEQTSSKRLMEALMEEASIPRDASKSLGPVTGERVERGGSESVLSSKL
ncbi:hypothetical protein FQN54_002649 [Arachnomyces sp. PD_36]|nr:hypothetical protein FQN54_002649 [Arachnomyces sp. PD_36]